MRNKIRILQITMTAMLCYGKADMTMYDDRNFKAAVSPIPLIMPTIAFWPQISKHTAEKC